MGVRGRFPKEEKPIKQVKISLHKQLTLQATKWLRKHVRNISIPNCPFIASEWLTYTLTGEMPDVIGWCNWTSVLIEVKVGRGDFLADAKKPFRKIAKEGMGNNAEAAKTDMLEAMNFHKETCIEEGLPYPDFLNEPFEINYTFDTKSLLEYYNGILSLSGLEKITGIHQKQLWNYLHTDTKPRRAQVEKIEQGLHSLGSELMSISL